MKLEVISQLLEEAGLGVRGETIFLHRMDAEVTRGIMIRPPIAGVPVHTDMPDYYKTTLQVIIRDPVQANGDTLARQVTQLLTMYRRNFNDDNGDFALQINQMFPEKLPIVYPLSAGNNIEWSLNFYVCYVMQGVN